MRADKQTDRQTNKQTDSNVLPTPTDIVGSYPRRPCRSAWVGRSSPSVCLRNSKTKDPKVFKLGTGNDLGIFYRSVIVLG